MSMTLEIEIDREADRRWMAEVPALSGVLIWRLKRQSGSHRTLSDPWDVSVGMIEGASRDFP
jgi:hypothetical protein